MISAGGNDTRGYLRSQSVSVKSQLLIAIREIADSGKRFPEIADHLYLCLFARDRQPIINQTHLLHTRSMRVKGQLDMISAVI